MYPSPTPLVVFTQWVTTLPTFHFTLHHYQNKDKLNVCFSEHSTDTTIALPLHFCVGNIGSLMTATIWAVCSEPVCTRSVPNPSIICTEEYIITILAHHIEWLHECGGVPCIIPHRKLTSDPILPAVITELQCLEVYVSISSPVHVFSCGMWSIISAHDANLFYMHWVSYHFILLVNSVESRDRFKELWN